MNGNLKTHAFRKYFASQLSRNLDLDPRFYNHLEGREASYRDQVYDNNIKKIDWFYQTWLKLEAYICVDCITVDKTDEEVLKLKEDNLKLNKQVEKLLENKIKEDEEKEELKDRLSKLEEAVKKVLDKI
jgi:septal ring factor EnvC (AmiA/AmiB activator)